MNKFLKIIAVSTLVLLVNSSFAQEILISEDVKSDTIQPEKGPNLKHYKHLYWGISFPFVTNEDVAYTQAGLSAITDFGLRFKRKLNKTFSVGTDFSFNWASYRIKQDEFKSIPDSTEHKREKFMINSISPDLYARINFGRRGNSIGTYLDLGAYGSLNVKRAYFTYDKIDGEIIKTTTSRLKYMEKYAYGLLARIGTNNLALTAKYRLSKPFTEESGFAELPKLSVGLEIGVFK